MCVDLLLLFVFDGTGYPPEQAVHEALATVREYLDEHHNEVRLCVCVCVREREREREGSVCVFVCS